MLILRDDYADALVTKMKLEGMSFQCLDMFFSGREKSECNETWLIIAVDCFFHIVLHALLKHNDIMWILTEVDINMKSKYHIEIQTLYVCVTRAYVCERPVYMCLCTYSFVYADYCRRMINIFCFLTRVRNFCSNTALGDLKVMF